MLPAHSALTRGVGVSVACLRGDACLLPAQGGRARLPDVFIADKNDTAKFQGEQAGKFALMALAVRRGEGGQLVAIEHVTPAVSNPFVVSGAGSCGIYRLVESTTAYLFGCHQPVAPAFNGGVYSV